MNPNKIEDFSLEPLNSEETKSVYGGGPFKPGSPLSIGDSGMDGPDIIMGAVEIDQEDSDNSTI